MFLFSAKYKNQIQSILIHRDLKVNEFLDALSYSLQLPEGIIVGFQDRSGLIITPSFIVSNPTEIKNEPYEVMLRSQGQSSVYSTPQHTQAQSLISPSQPQYGGSYSYGPSNVTSQQNLNASNTSTLLLDTSSQLNQMSGARQQHSNYQNVQHSPSPLESYQPYQSPNFGINNQAQPLASSLNSRSFHSSNDRTVLSGSGTNFNPQAAYSNGLGAGPNDVQNQLNHQNDIILFVSSLQTDALLTENVKNKIISKARLRDSGIYGAYSLYLVDGDVEGFKARIIHRALTPPTPDYLSSATTAQFNWATSVSRQSTAGGYRSQTRENSRIRGALSAFSNSQSAFANSQPSGATGQHMGGSAHLAQPLQPPSQDRYVAVIVELESKGLLDEPTASLLKTLVLLEENVELFRAINAYIAQAISDRELSFKLSRLSMQLSNYIERPQSPLPRKKIHMLNYVNSLARYHFSDPDDIQLLTKLIYEENEFILSCFDVFDSDRDQDNLIDSLHRILEKSKAMGLHANSLTASSFYNQNPWNRTNAAGGSQAANPQTANQNQGNNFANASFPQSQSQSSIRHAQPYISKWEERNPASQNSQNANQSHFANQSQIAPRSSERPQGAIGSRRQGNNTNGTSLRRVAGAAGQGQPPTNFQNTTVHNVALIPNYFSSGEEEASYFNNNNSMVQQPGTYQNQGSRANSRVARGNQYPHYQVRGGYQHHGVNNHFGGAPTANPYQDNYLRRDRAANGGDSFNQQEEFSDDFSRGGGRAQNQRQKKVAPHYHYEEEDVFPLRQEHQTSNRRDKEDQEDSEAEEIKTRGQKNNQRQAYERDNQNQRSRAKSHAKDQHIQQESQTHSVKDSKHSRKKQGKRDNSSDSEDSSDRDSSADNKKRKDHKSKSKQHSKIKSKSKGNKSSKRRRHDTSSSDSSSSRSDHSSDSQRSDSSDSQRDKKGKSHKGKESSSKHKSTAKSDNKKNTKKKDPISKEEIDSILEEEEVEGILRPENSAMLQIMLRDKDQDMIAVFFKFSEEQVDSEYLISSIEKMTEDALQYLFMRNFSNEEHGRITSLRSQRNPALKKVLKKFKKTLDKAKFIKGVQKVLETQVTQSPSHPINSQPQRSSNQKAKQQLVLNVGQNAQGNNEESKQQARTNVAQEIIRPSQIQSSGRNVSNQSPVKSAVVKMPSRKEKLESVFNMIYHADFGRVESVAKVIYQMFHRDQDAKLLDILEAYRSHNNYLDLKNQVEEYMRQKVQGFEAVIKEEPEMPQDIEEAINLFTIRGEMGVMDQQLLLKLYKEQNKHLLSSWEAFKYIRKMDDLLDSLLILAEIVKKNLEKEKQQQKQIQQQQQQPPQYVVQMQMNFAPKPVEQPQTQVPAQSRSIFGGGLQPAPIGYTPQEPKSLFSIEPQSQQQDDEDTDERQSDQNLNIDHNPDESDHEDQDFQSIIQYQHKILRKYTMRGLIKYSDSPIFHEMVDSKDYKMISIFEVFAVNRDEDDFLENLGLLAQIYLEDTDTHDNDGEENTDGESHAQISEDFETENTKATIQQKQPQVQAEAKPVQQQILQQQPATQVHEIAAAAPQEDIDLYDENGPTPKEISTNPRFGVLVQFKLSLKPEEYRWSVLALRNEHKQVLSVIKAWEMLKDNDDLVHSLQRLYKRQIQNNS